MSYYDIVDIADLDCIYLSYDEPQKEEFWLKIKNLAPWTKRVDGIKGSDAAHKAAAEISNTERFILIDGDNMPNEDFFSLQLDFTKKDESFKKAQFRWKALNHINGLRYGNGGISSWTKEYVFNMKTHENQTEGDSSRIVDFCLSRTDNLYWAMWDCYSTTYPNFTPFQAWRAGFREGVKMCLNRGLVPSIDEFKTSVSPRNINNLSIWHNIGRDVDNGEFAIYGSQYGTYMTMLTDWNHLEVHWFDNYPNLWDDFMSNKYNDTFLFEMAEALKTKLGLSICNFMPDESKFFKRHYGIEKYNRGPLFREMDILREMERH